MMVDAETEAVRFELRSLEPVRGREPLVGLAVVDMEVAGVRFTLQGVGVMRRKDGGLTCRAPVWRHPTGVSLPGVLLPPELAEALAGEVLGAWTATADPRSNR